jgi:hypothetical protein
MAMVAPSCGSLRGLGFVLRIDRALSVWQSWPKAEDGRGDRSRTASRKRPARERKKADLRDACQKLSFLGGN